ncbi:hypothetical protein HWV07_04330 [Natronomonas salina]|uniref:hypothetical protein n=1 Tax=Natronomonas salina TaxID=1710540 RepID=UPI0015B75BCB|nr:hypothetical protein [Natronomonas salina]QLD88301.1 hypothetical protein HWV07_04330 [Natronomonas salina]
MSTENDDRPEPKTTDRTERMSTLRKKLTFTAKAGDSEPRLEWQSELERLESADWEHASERVETIHAKLSGWSGPMPDDLEATLREEACDLAGVDEYEAALAAYGIDVDVDDSVGEIHARLASSGSAMPADHVAELKAEACEAAGTETFGAACEERGLERLDHL